MISRWIHACSGLLVLLMGSTGAWPDFDRRGVQDPSLLVVLETSRGDIVIELFPEKSPKTVANFLHLVQSGFYDEMLFHRVVNDIVIQVGLLSMDGEVRGMEVQPIENESRNRLTNRRGTLGMAREGDPESATTEFFINVQDNPEFDYVRFPRRRWGFAVFGRVIDGMAVVDEIANIPTKRVGPFPNFPSDPVAVYRAYVRK